MADKYVAEEMSAQDAQVISKKGRMEGNVVDVYCPVQLANPKTTNGSRTNTWRMGPFPPTNAVPDVFRDQHIGPRTPIYPIRESLHFATPLQDVEGFYRPRSAILLLSS